MRRILPNIAARLLALGLLAGPALGAAADSAAGTAGGREPEGAGPVLLVLGDSLSAAYGMPIDQGWVELLRRRLADSSRPGRIVNASISGDTTTGGLARLPALLAEYEPDLVILGLGANDGLRGFTPAQTAANLERLIGLAHDAGAEVLLLGVPLPPNYGLAYTGRFQRMYAEVAGRTNVALVPGLLDGVADNPRLMQEDELHPTAEAQPIMLGHVWKVLEPLLANLRN